MIRSFIFISLFTLSSCGVALQLTKQKASITAIDNTTIELNGILGKQMHKKLVAYLTDHPAINRIVLNQIPGSINDEWNVKTCMFVNNENIETYLRSTSVIASGGVDLFISGTSRQIEEGAKIGVHSWSDGKKDGSEYPRNSEEHQLFIDFFDQIEMDTSFYWFTLEAAPAKDIHWMNEAEINRFELKK